jgi:outer membrane protein W
MRLALAALALVAATPAFALSENYQPIRVDTGITFLSGSADIAEYGIGASVEPKLNVTDHFAVGLRLEGAALVPESVSVGPDNVSMGVRAVSAYLAKADYYLTTSSVRPFVGLGAGLYRIGGVTQSVSGTSVVQQAEAFSGFGVAPQVGINFGGFRLAATYHLITGGDRVVVTQAVGAAPVRQNMPTSYIALELGGTFGGERLQAPVTP